MFQLSNFYNIGKTQWDAVRFADKAKNTKVTKSRTEAEADRSLRQHFHEAHFKDLTEPTTILDRHGKVIVWALPDILHPNHLVRSRHMHLLYRLLT